MKRTDLGKFPPYRSHAKTLYGEQSGNCAGCGEHFQARHLEVDHIIAQHNGGTDHIDNLQLLCSSCNRIKGDRGMEYLRDKLQRLHGDVLTLPPEKRHDINSLLDLLKEHGISRSRLKGDMTVREHIQQLNRSHLMEVQARLINREEIVREESAAAVEVLLDQGKSVVIEGVAGSGKSCVLAQLMGHLNDQGVPCLVLRLDRLDGHDQRSQAIGTRLGLPESPAITLGELADDKPSVLVVDQLDAISEVSARNQAVWSAFYELLDEVHVYPNMRILFACRSFDLEHDPRLRGLVDDQEQAERIPMGSLGEDVIRKAIAVAGLDPTSLCQRQMKILSTPLHLHLLLESANSGPVEFSSPRDLFEAFWEHKEQAVATHMGGDQDALTDCDLTACVMH